VAEEANDAELERWLADFDSIVVEPSRTSEGKPQVKIGNFGTCSVLDIELTRLEIRGQPEPVPERRTSPVVAPAHDSPRHDNSGIHDLWGHLHIFFTHKWASHSGNW
jgi:hypothetical protein